MRIYIKNLQRRRKVNRQKIASLLRKALRLLKLHRAELSILLVNDDRMRTLNREHRGIDRTTDVLSFPQVDSMALLSQDVCSGTTGAAPVYDDLVLGDIVINLHRTERQAKEYGVSFNEELKRLLIHGLLHLLGYDHEEGEKSARRMRKKAQHLFERI